VKTLARAATSALGALCLGLVLVAIAVAAIGIAGTHASTRLGNDTANDELTTSTATGELARDMDTTYATGEEVFLAAGQTERSRLLGLLYTSILPATDTQLAYLERLHANDPPAEHANVELFVRQWITVRDLLSPTGIPSHQDTTLAARLTAAYQPVGAQLDSLFRVEQQGGHSDQVGASASEVRTTFFIVGAAVLGIMTCVLLLLSGIRRIRRNLKPGQDQADFADTLQIANDEEEAHQLLQLHLERALTGTAAVVLNRNNSADRLEAVTPLPEGSPLAETLRGARPRSCLAVRSGRMHREDQTRSALLRCPVCASCPGASSCFPLTVGGEVIGSVLLNRPRSYAEAEEEQIRESVGQAAPVLANLRNLAIAEIRAATDSLTGLPNQRAAADTLNRMFAQATTTASPLALLFLDLDHFKQINDQRGHAVGDQVLANVGAVLRKILRSRDFAARNGGEEFAVLLPDTEIPAALAIAERIRAAIAEISLPGTDVSVTISIGVSGFPDHANTLDRLERLADAALYLAKRLGRNRVELAEPAAGNAPAGLPEPLAVDAPAGLPVPVASDAPAGLPVPVASDAPAGLPVPVASDFGGVSDFGAAGDDFGAAVPPSRVGGS
jgi:diguanylate cyclase (GGDEF)-like protein